MVWMAKSTKNFEFFWGLNPGTVRVSTDNSKDNVNLVMRAISRPTNASFRFRVSQFFRYLLRNAGSFKEDKNVRADKFKLNYCSNFRTFLAS